MTLRNLGILAVVLAVGIAAYVYMRPTPQPTAAGTARPIVANVVVPALTPLERDGQVKFDQYCVGCHGENAAGQEGSGPPFVDPIYKPGHHGDMAFMLAPRNGVRAHHWPFGDMPPVSGVTDEDLKAIIAYVRAIQRANGIN